MEGRANKEMRKNTWILSALVLLVAGYFWLTNLGAENMTGRQKFLRGAYPVLQGIGSIFGSKKGKYKPEEPVTPATSFHALKWVSNSGEETDMSQYRGKKVLVVNTASDCGFTPQFEDLQALQVKYADRLVVVGFPANDFKQQEKGGDADIAQFCRKNYGVTFPLAAKSSVVKGPNQNPVFAWLTDPSRNGWNDRQPVWNFSKYLVDEEGRLIGFFESSVDPADKDIVMSIEGRP
jgi:glutathione peroxidase